MLVLIGFMLLSQNVMASSVVPPVNPGALVHDSDHVVIAKAVRSKTAFRGRSLVTMTTFEILRSVKGYASGTLIEAETPGGVSGDIGLTITGSPNFSDGEIYLLFLRSTEDGVLRPSMLSYGVMQLVGTMQDGILMPIDQTWDLELVPRKDFQPVELIQPYKSSQFIQHLQHVADGAAWNSADFVLDGFMAPGRSNAIIDNLIPPGCDYLVYQGSPIRWNRFDTDLPVTFYISDTASNLQQTSVQAGLILWSDLEDFSFAGKLGYGGKRSFTPNCEVYESAAEALLDEDGAFLIGDGMVQFNDPCSEIPDLTPNGGVLAFGGTFFFLTTHKYNSLDWRTSALAFVVVNNGSESFLGPIQYNQMMAHELGHTLGFGHHTTEPALMNAFCCNSLSQIDVGCAVLPYGTLPPNDPPVIANQLEDITLYSPGAAFVKSLTSPQAAFTDPDGDPLQYSVMSTNGGVVFAEMASLTAIRLVPNNVGEAVVLVRATDPRGAFVTMEVNVVVEPKINVVPEVVRAPDPVSINEDAVFQLELEGAEPFVIDKDGDDLIYTVTSQDPSIVSATVIGTLLRITGEGPGVSKIVVVADDQSGGKAELEITVSVNGKPTVLYVPEPILLVAQSTAATFNVVQPLLFRDPEGGALAYSITNSAPLFFDATLSGTIVTMTPKTPGNGVVNVTATDPAGNSSSVAIPITVQARPNRNPVVANNPGALALRAGDVANEYNLDGEQPVFTDPDGDSLSYSAISSLNRVATAAIEGSVIKITPLETGSATITVFATDNFGGFASVAIPLVVGVSVSLEEESLPDAFQVGSAYPNPFNPTTVIPMRQAFHEAVQLTVYDVMGRLVYARHYGLLQPGTYSLEVPFNGKPSGVYIVTVRSGNQVLRQRVTLLK